MSRNLRCAVPFWLAPVLLLTLLIQPTGAQSLQTTPYSSPSLLRGLSGQGLDMAPSNPLQAPGTSGPWSSGGSDSVVLSSGMFQGLLPPIPNLQFGYLYSFSNNYGSGRVTGDYLKPFSLNKESFVFGEAHAEGWNFWNSGGTNGNSGGRVNNRVDVSLGGGYRKFFGNQALIGVNGFYDTTRLTGNWYSSGSLGFQAAWLLPGSDAIDLNFNWYGKLLNGYQWVNTFRHGPSNYDFEAGYSHEIWDGGPDLRLKIKGYSFDVGSTLRGWTGGAELKSRDGMFVLKYEAGYDRLDNTYQTIGGYINTGFQLENLFKGESPFSAPTPIFRSPRNLSYMASQPVSRNWSQPAAAVITRATVPSVPSVPAAHIAPYFQFYLVDKKDNINGGVVAFDQDTGVPLTALTWPWAGGANPGACTLTYAVAIVDPGGTLPATISVLLSPVSGDFNNFSVEPTYVARVGRVPYIIVACTTNGLLNNAGFPDADPYGTAIYIDTGRGGTGTINITDITAHTEVTPLTVTVTAN